MNTFLIYSIASLLINYVFYDQRMGLLHIMNETSQEKLEIVENEKLESKVKFHVISKNGK